MNSLFLIMTDFLKYLLLNNVLLIEYKLFRTLTLVNLFVVCSLLNWTGYIGCAESKRRSTFSVGVHRRTNTNWMRISMGFSRRTYLTSDATNFDRNMPAVTNILCTQGTNEIWLNKQNLRQRHVVEFSIIISVQCTFNIWVLVDKELKNYQ